MRASVASSVSGRPYLSSVGRAVAVGQDALAGVALGGRVGILIHGAGNLVRAVLAVAGVSVAEEELVNAVSVSALEVAFRTDGLIRLEVGAVHARLGETVAVLNLSKQKGKENPNYYQVNIFDLSSWSLKLRNIDGFNVCIYGSSQL